MGLMQRTLAGALVLLAASLAHAEGIEWVARDARATAVAGGGSDALAFHVCRAALASGAVVPGKFWTSGDRGGECHIAVGGAEQAVAEFQVLAEKAGSEAAYAWVPGHATGFPQRSVIGGSSAEGQRLLVCAAVHGADGSVHAGYIEDENCVYARDGAQLAADQYLVLVTNDATVTTTDSAQPAAGGFDPGAILAGEGVAAFCALKDGACVPSLPPNF
jgi:hypothetical protein